MTDKMLEFSVFENIIDGRLSPTRQTRQCINPSTLELNPPTPVSGQDDVDRAVKAARKAFVSWSNVTIDARKEAVINFANALAKEADRFAEMLTKEQGRPLMLARLEVQTAVQWLLKQAGMEFQHEEIQERPDTKIITRYTPLGITVGIVPWNFPITIACGKIAPALITGNVFIMKPSPFTPYCGLKLCELAQAYFPPAVFQCLSGNDDLGPLLTQHDDVNKISFTGSIETGRDIMRSCSQTLKRMTLELGGNDAAIVFPDVDITSAAASLAQLAWFNSGQVCVAVKRIYIHASIYDRFLEAFAAVTRSLVLGDGFDEASQIGPVSNSIQYDRVRSMVSDLASQKQAISTGSRTTGPSSQGYFIEPTIVDNPPDTSRVVQEEPFGPVLPLLKWEDEDDVVERANATIFGLGASVWSQDMVVAQRVAKRLEAGTVWINNHMQLDPTVENAPYKQSGFGVEYGLTGMRSYCNMQSIHLPNV